MRIVLQGIGVCPGVGSGRVLHLSRTATEEPEATPTGPPDEEFGRAATALTEVAAALNALRDDKQGPGADVLAAQELMATDPAVVDLIRRLVTEGRSAARAIWDAFAAYRDMLAAAGDYVAARVADLDDVRDRALARLLGLPAPGIPESETPYVLIARDLAPADTITLEPGTVVGLVTEEGGPTSHTAIIARSLGIPAVVACSGALAISEGAQVLVDGGTGTVRVDATVDERRSALAAAGERRRRIANLSGPGQTLDGHRVALLANVSGPRDAQGAIEAGAEGIGLFRTEMLFIDQTGQPDWAAQEASYREVLSAFAGKVVTVRLLDAGADKPLAFLASGPEVNPALGVRGIRLLRAHDDVLGAQLQALVHAADGAGAALSVMAPMVADAAEARWFADTARAAGIQRVGVMVEVPSAAVRARDLVDQVDFLSLGTNDLAQYTFAADRQVAALASWQNPWNPALLDLIALTFEAARGAAKPCGVCGEAAGDPLFACVLTGLGVTSLSMAAAAIAPVRAAIAGNSLDRCRLAAERATSANSAALARAAAAETLRL